MPRMTNVLLVGRSKAALQSLYEEFSWRNDCSVEMRVITNGHIDPLHQLKTDPDIVFVRLSEKYWHQELEALEQRSKNGGPEVVIVGEPDNGAAMRMAIRAGARDYVNDPIDRVELDQAIRRITRDLYNPIEDQGVISAFFNVRGGSGSSFLASNAAHIMAEASNFRVALVDLDLTFGNLAQYFDLEAKRDLHQALREADHLDSIALDAYMAKHRSGLRILSTVPEETQLFANPPVEGLNALLDLLAERFDHIVLDVPRRIDEFTATALGRAENIILVTEQSLSHMRDASCLMNILKKELGIPEQRIQVVLNRFDKSAAVTQVDVEQTLSRKDLIVIPNDYRKSIESVNTGIPLYECARRSKITDSLMKLETRLGGHSRETSPGRLARTVASFLGT